MEEVVDFVLNSISLPYDVPAEFVAYALRWYVFPANNPVIELVNEPIPAPSTVLLSDIVGFMVNPQHTPRATILAFPLAVTTPPLVALMDSILETSVVESLGGVVWSSSLHLNTKNAKKVKANK